MQKIQEIENLKENTWIKADTWILKNIISDIESFKNIAQLSEHLKENISEEYSDKEKTLEWLNDFFIFLLENERLELLSEKTIYPDQLELGQFHKKSELFQDIDIPCELKDILEDFEKEQKFKNEQELNEDNEDIEEKEDNEKIDFGWRSILLDKTITAFNEKYKLSHRTVKDISDKINNEFIENIEYDSIVEWRNIILQLIGYSKDKQTEQHQKVWEFARTLYNDATPEIIKILPNTKEFEWNVCIKWLVNKLIIDISDLKFVSALENELYGNITAIKWLDRVIDFLQDNQNFKHLLTSEDYFFIPNQSDEFCVKSTLYIDAEIPEELKEVIKILNRSWYDELLNENIFLKIDRARDKKDAAIEIDRIFREYPDNKDEPKFMQAWNILRKWFKEQDEQYIKDNFDWIYRKRAELSLAAIGEKQYDNIAKIIEDGNAEVLTKIANGLSKDALNDLSENPNEYENYKEWTKSGKKTASPKTILNEVNKKTGKNFHSIEEITNFIEEKQAKPSFALKDAPAGYNYGTGGMDMEPLKKANEDARDALYKSFQNSTDYNVNEWDKKINDNDIKTKTIIPGVMKNGTYINIVIKAANSGVIYFDKKGKEQKILLNTFSELWVHFQNKLYHITLGEIIDVWTKHGMNVTMFKFN